MMTSASSSKNQDTWHGIVHAYTVLTVITMATLQLTAQTRYHHQVPLLGTEEGHQTTTAKTDHILGIIIEMDTDTTPHPETHTQTQDITITETDTDIVSQDSIHTITATEVAADTIQGGDILDHTADPHTAAHHTIDTLIHTASDATHHTGDLCITGVFPETIASPDLTPFPNTKHLQDQTTPTARQNRAVKPINKSPSMTHHRNTIVLTI